MAFIAFSLPLNRKREERLTSASTRFKMATSYLSPGSLNVNFQTCSKNGSFGAIFMGEYIDPVVGTKASSDVVVKCPIKSDIGRELYNMEKYTNLKLNKSFVETKRFPEYIGEVIIPNHYPIVTGLSRLGLVWRRVGNGETLEDYINSARVSGLMSLLGVRYESSSIRRRLAASLLLELSLIVKDLQSCGIVHRDLKPENILVVPGDPSGLPLRVIDFAPEKRLSLFKPAYRFDVYSVGLIVLRCALPSLTEAAALSNFVFDILSKYSFSFERACYAISNGRLATSRSLLQDIQELMSPTNEDLYAILAIMLTENPSSRADVDDCLSCMLLRSEFV
ncbi:unnamed protein product [Agarophyton chilense]